MLFARSVRLLGGRERRASCAPLKPPRDTSYGLTASAASNAASRGKALPSNFMPLSVVSFCSGPSPNTEYPVGAPSAPGTICTPGTPPASSARSASCSSVAASTSTRRSPPPASMPVVSATPRFRGAVTFIVSSTAPARASLTSATSTSRSATRRSSTRLGENPIAVTTIQ